MVERGTNKFVFWGCLLLVIGAFGIDSFGQNREREPKQMSAAVKSTAKTSSEATPTVVPEPRLSLKSSLENRDRFRESHLNLSLLKNIALDQRDIWTSPRNLRVRDTEWAIPLAGFMAGSLMADTSVSEALTSSPSRVSKSNSLSNYGIAALAGGVGGMYLWGKMTHDDHKSETGLLAGEAAVNALVVSTALKYSFGRQRPTEGPGGFWHGGTSFPSDHAAVAWSAASVIAHEYPGPLTKLFVYGLASAVTVSRVTGKDHFPTDALVGSAIGWLIGREIYSKHHDPDLGGGAAPPLLAGEHLEQIRDGRQTGSPYVPLDSWVYPAFERLAALGYVQTGYLGLRPWTRIECAQLVEEAGDLLRQREAEPPEATSLYQSLSNEFAGDLKRLAGDQESTVRLESIYTRAMDISGAPLRDSYHFGQTLINDFGRPYGEGANAISGFSGWASSGRFAVYVRGEYQHAPSAPAYSQQVRDAIAQMDSNPVQSAQPIATVNRFNLLDAYAALNVGNWELSFGKQSLWWAPNQGGSLMLSDNAEPFLMFRARRTAISKLPWILGHLGPMKMDLFFGQLAGNQFPPRPLIHGEKISFKPSPNMEFGFSRTSEFGGVGRPITLGAIMDSYISLSSSAFHPANKNPGKRTLGLDFSYRVPGARNWITLYAEGLLPEANPLNVDTNPSPLYAPRRTAINTGIYMPRVPRVPKLDFRFEAAYTDPPTPRSSEGEYTYWDFFYHDLYTNQNNLIGHWVGREGMGFQGWATYWFSPRDSIQFGYRHAKVASDFVPGGESLNDGTVKANWWVKRDVSLSAYVQYEKWSVPILASIPQTNWTSSVEIAFWPRSWSW